MTKFRLTMAMVFAVCAAVAACDGASRSDIDTSRHEEENRNWNGPD